MQTFFSARGWQLLMGVVVAMGLSSCATTTNSRPDLVWTEDGTQYGKASWYDDHGDRTANGELYNMYAMTAAHPSLALNTVVEVTNLDTGKSITVRVNDRLPPIHNGRVIDLSKAAFRKLDALENGLINVALRVVRHGNNKYLLINQAAPSGKMYLKPRGSSTKSVSSKTTKAAPKDI
jgi:rare lipoprotein A